MLCAARPRLVDLLAAIEMQQTAIGRSRGSSRTHRCEGRLRAILAHLSRGSSWPREDDLFSADDGTDLRHGDGGLSDCWTVVLQNHAPARTVVTGEAPDDVYPLVL